MVNGKPKINSEEMGIYFYTKNKEDTNNKSILGNFEKKSKAGRKFPQLFNS